MIPFGKRDKTPYPKEDGTPRQFKMLWGAYRAGEFHSLHIRLPFFQMNKSRTKPTMSIYVGPISILRDRNGEWEISCGVLGVPFGKRPMLRFGKNGGDHD